MRYPTFRFDLQLNEIHCDCRDAGAGDAIDNRNATFTAAKACNTLHNQLARAQSALEVATGGGNRVGWLEP